MNNGPSREDKRERVRKGTGRCSLLSPLKEIFFKKIGRGRLETPPKTETAENGERKKRRRNIFFHQSWEKPLCVQLQDENVGDSDRFPLKKDFEAEKNYSSCCLRILSFVLLPFFASAGYIRETTVCVLLLFFVEIARHLDAAALKGGALGHETGFALNVQKKSGGILLLLVIPKKMLFCVVRFTWVHIFVLDSRKCFFRVGPSWDFVGRCLFASPYDHTTPKKKYEFQQSSPPSLFPQNCPSK